MVYGIWQTVYKDELCFLKSASFSWPWNQDVGFCCSCPYCSKYPNRRYVPNIIIMIPNIPNVEALHTLYCGTLDPWGVVF